MTHKITPFHIAIGSRSPDGTYAVHAATGRAEATTSLRLPERLLASADLLLQPGTMLPIGDAPAFGRALGHALLTPPLRELLLRAVARGQRRLQIQLQLAAPELAALPWEWLTLGSAAPWSPALRDDYTLVRVGRRGRQPSPAAIAGPLRILALGGPDEELQLDVLEGALQRLVRGGQIELRLLPGATPVALERALAAGPVHVLHCATPFAFTARGAPRLALGRGREPIDLAALLADADRLRLVTLTGPQGDATKISAALPALATTLVGEDLPATIAFSGPLPALLAARFSAACYARLAAGAPVDLAATAGRRALAERGDRGWGHVQVRLVPGGEQLFTFSRPRRAAARTRLLLPAAGAAATLALVLWLGIRSISAPVDKVPTAVLSQPLVLISSKPTQPAATPEPTAWPTATPTATLAPTPLPAPASYATFLTAQGDTLESIAARMGSDGAAIAALNRLDPQAPLRPERPLVIPVYRQGESGAGSLIVRNGNPAAPKVALTFDIEIDAATLFQLLEILRARGIHGTFFVTGGWVQSFPDAARAIVAEGHEIGNHSLTHPFFSRIGYDGAANELEQTERIVSETTGVTTRPYFRFPYGDSTPKHAAIVAGHGYVAYHWSADDQAISGWLAGAAQNPAAANGGILLMHGRPSTVEALPGWLDQLAAMGLQPTTLGDVLR